MSLVAGNWSDWQNHTSCSLPCGSGWQIIKRECNNPDPGLHGEHCEMENGTLGLTEMKNVTCNTHSCPGRSFYNFPTVFIIISSLIIIKIIVTVHQMIRHLCYYVIYIFILI